MDNLERERVLRYLADSRDMLLSAADGLSAEQRCFRAAEDRWSVADCIEHLSVVENFILTTIERMLAEAPGAEKPDTGGKDEAVLTKVPGRGVRVKGPAAVMPTGRWPDFEELLGVFESTRERTVAFAGATQADLRAVAFPHPILGPLDGYQWLLFLAAHCERHVKQMEEVKSDPAFPTTAVGSAWA